MLRYKLALLLIMLTTSRTLGQSEGSDKIRSRDRSEIRAHIESIFQAFIDQDSKKLRETHTLDWRGFFENSTVPVRGIAQYMEATGIIDGEIGKNRDGLVRFSISEFDIVFHDPHTAVVSFLAETEGQSGWKSRLRILDFYVKKSGNWIQAASFTGRAPIP